MQDYVSHFCSKKSNGLLLQMVLVLEELASKCSMLHITSYLHFKVIYHNTI